MEVLFMPSFWNNVVYALKIVGPLIGVLRLVNGERKPTMGYIYEAMDRAKEAIARSFGGNENDEVTNGLYTCIERLVPDVETRCAIDLELSKYKKVEGLFGSPMGVRMREKKSLEEDNLTWNAITTAAGVEEPGKWRAGEELVICPIELLKEYKGSQRALNSMTNKMSMGV
ncbi:hypothetical protein Ddye_023039 [Dipteronia dyeriana]|uniref:Uncharacterized protein n=1 Tax=Dipteronia dyeriana TaxID=168575 RepID=A0AAD9TSC5_9ROSI|nr:hypothetical protein Ddye_023039 [Dipteronia dyeriana]